MQNEEIYKEFMCYDRVNYYILKDCFGIEDMELLFLDRYMGFYQNQDMSWSNHLDGMSDYIFKSGITECSKIKTEALLDYFEHYIKPGDKVVTVAQFFYPDKVAPYPYHSYLIIEKFTKDNIIMTKLSNVDQKIQYKDTYDHFIELIENKDEIELYHYRREVAIEKLGDKGQINSFQKILINNFGYSVEFLNKKYNEIIGCKNCILENANYHKERLDHYLFNGIHRNEYSSFVRRIHELLYASFQALVSLQEHGEHVSIELMKIQKELENSIDVANRHILAFIWTKEIDVFNKYYEECLNTARLYDNYRMLFHDKIVKGVY